MKEIDERKPRADLKLWETSFMVKTAIVNVVATAALSQKIELVELGQFEEVFYDSDVYGGRVAYFKTETMQGKVTIFTSGKMISVGTKSEDTAFNELEAAKEFLVKKGIINNVSLQPKTRNMVITADFGTAVNLEDLSLKKRVIYEPEQFPGAILEIIEPYKTTVLVFASGKAVVTGLTSASQIEPIIEKVRRLLREVI